MLISGAPAGRRIGAGSLFARYILFPFLYGYVPPADIFGSTPEYDEGDKSRAKPSW